MLWAGIGKAQDALLSGPEVRVQAHLIKSIHDRAAGWGGAMGDAVLEKMCSARNGVVSRSGADHDADRDAARMRILIDAEGNAVR